MSDVKRDTNNAVALGVAVMTAAGDTEDSLDAVLKCQGWDIAIGRIDAAAEALDTEIASYPHPTQFWWEHDWYLTIDKVAEELVARPDAEWTFDRVRRCLVSL